MRMIIAIIGLLAAPVAAHDVNGFRAISGGDLAAAETALLAQRQEYPARPELMLNLAHIYAKTDRAAQARLLYREVLKRRAVAMDMANGAVIDSHALAQIGLSRLNATTIAAR